MSGISTIRPDHKTGAACLLLALLVAIFGAAAMAPQAKAAPTSITFDNGRLTIGGLWDNKVILPASSTFPSDDLPLPQRTDIQLMGDLTDGKVTIPSALNSGLQFPYVHLMHPIEQGLRIPITMRLNDPGLTGTFDEATGRMTLKGKLDFIVVTGTGTNFPLPDSLTDLGVPPLGLFARCRVNGVPVNFSTETQSPTAGQNFSGGFGVKGALTTKWDELPLPESENGGDCEQLNTLLSVPGGLWLSNGIVKPKPPEQPKPTCQTDQDLCPNPTYTEVDRVKLSPRKRSARPGKTIRLKVRVHNSGTRAAPKQRVRFRSNNRAVKVPKQLRLRVPARGWGKTTVKVRITGKARGRARIIAVANGWRGAALIRIAR